MTRLARGAAHGFALGAAWGLLALAGSVGVGIWAGLGDITVTYVVGYVALALALAWASSLVWQRSARHRRETDVAPTEDRPERVSPRV